MVQFIFKAIKNSRLLPMLVVLVMTTLFAGNARALVLTSYFEAILVPDVSTSWTTVSLDNTYSDAIVVCTYVLGTFEGSSGNYTNNPAVTRINNIQASSFDLKVQGWGSSTASTSDVHCMIMEDGAHTLPDGRLVEAHSVVSDQTSGQFATDGGWSLALMEDVSADIVNTYTSPVVVGQVMSYNDTQASTIYINDCDSRNNNPFHAGMSDGICVGKHISMEPDVRNDETIGYIVAETGSGTINNVFYELALGADAVAGNNGGNTGYTYGLTNHHSIAVLTQGGEDGGNGSWAVLYGDDSLTANSMQLAVDEEANSYDKGRAHTAEPVYYWAFAAAEITLIKSVINDDSGTATIADFVLSAIGTDSVTGISGTTSVTDATVTPGTYVLSETTMPGYTAVGWVCTDASKFDGSFTIALAPGDRAICTITNDDNKYSTLTLIKTLDNNAGGTAVVSDFTLKYSFGTETGSGVTGDASITSADVPPGLYSLKESTVPGYVLDGIKCDGIDSDGSDGVEIQAGENVTCYFINNDQGVDLAIAKSVNDTSPNIGDTLTFTLLVSNVGQDTATNLTVLDPIPDGFSYVASSMSGGDLTDDSSPSGTGLNWTINTLLAGASTSLTFQATVLAP